MSRLYSYCLPFDDGAAPNPYWDVCTLVICKPRIRASAQEGDWIAGTGAKFARRGDGTWSDTTGRLVYAMKVTKIMTMREYNEYTQRYLPAKIPQWNASERKRRLGDSLYDFSVDPPKQREGVHGPSNAATDISGKNALLSDHFLYFGANAVEIPPELRAIAQNRQGHRVRLNEPYVERFVSWVEGLGHGQRQVLGQPLLDLFQTTECAGWCASGRGEADEEDEELVEERSNRC